MSGDDAKLKLAIKNTALDDVDRCHMQMQADLRRDLGKQGDGFVNVGNRIAGRLVEYRNGNLPSHTSMDLVHTSTKCICTRQ